MKGRAFNKCELRDVDGNVVYSRIESMSNSSVLKWWRFIGSSDETRVRRVRRYRAWLRHPSTHAHVTAVALGRFVWEEFATMTNGEIDKENANFLSVQMQADFEFCCDRLESYRAIGERVDGHFGKLFLPQYAEVATDYLKLDPAEIRAASAVRTVAVPPPGSRDCLASGGAEQTEAAAEPRGCVCQIIKDDGNVCGLKWKQKSHADACHF